LLTLWLTISLTVTGARLAALFFGHLASPLRWDDAVAHRYTLPAADFYLDQPCKNLAFAAGCLATPPILILSYLLSRWVVGRAGTFSLRLMTVVGSVVTWLFFFWCLFPLIHCPNPPFAQEPPSWLLYGWLFKQHLFPNAVPFWFFLVALVFSLFFWRCRSSIKHLNWSLAVLIVVWAAASPAHFYAPAEVKDDWRFTFHLNPILDPLGQSADGRHFLVDFPDIYGGYTEILGPILLLFPRGIETPLLALGLLNAFSVLGLLLTARLIIRQPFLLFLTGLGLLGVEYVMTTLEHYYQYFAIRMIFPSAGLVLAALYFRRPGWLAYGAASVVAALSSVWNLDTGIVLWASWTATLLAMGWSTGGWTTSLRHFGIQAVAFCAAWAAFFLYLRMASGRWPDPGMLFIFQRFVVGAGYYCLAIIFPDAWVIVLTIYITGLAVALAFYLRGNPPWKIHFMLMLSLMGIGLFDYFMGRSAESNLVSVSYPAILLIGLLVSEAKELIAQRKLPRISWVFLSPTMLILLWWSFLFIWAEPEQSVRSIDVVMKWQSGKPSPIEDNFAFVKKWTLPHERVFMLSGQSGFYYYLTDTVCPIKVPEPGMLFWREDMNRLIAALDSGQLPKLFVDQNFFEDDTYRPEIYQQIQQAISGHYQAKAASPSGRVILYVPR
jgi:hypothetical protein